MCVSVVKCVSEACVPVLEATSAAAALLVLALLMLEDMEYVCVFVCVTDGFGSVSVRRYCTYIRELRALTLWLRAL